MHPMAVFLTLILQIRLLVNALRLRNLRQRVHGNQLEIVVAQHRLVLRVVIDARLDIEVAHVHRHRDGLLVVRQGVDRGWGFTRTPQTMRGFALTVLDVWEGPV